MTKVTKSVQKQNRNSLHQRFERGKKRSNHPKMIALN